MYVHVYVGEACQCTVICTTNRPGNEECYMLMRDEEGRKKEASKVKTNNKAKQHSTCIYTIAIP